MSKRVKNTKSVRKTQNVYQHGLTRITGRVRGKRHTRFIVQGCLGWRRHSKFVRDPEVPYGMGEVREELNLIRNSK